MADTLKQVQLDRSRMIENNKRASESSRTALSAISGRLVLKTKKETEKMRRDKELALRENEAFVALNQAAGNVALEKSKLAAAQYGEALELQRKRLELGERSLALKERGLDLKEGQIGLESERLDWDRERLEMERESEARAWERLGFEREENRRADEQLELSRQASLRDQAYFEEQKKRRKKDEVLSMLNMGVYDPSFAAVLGMPEDVVRQAAANKKAKLDQLKAARAKVAQAQADYEAALAARNGAVAKEKAWYETDVDSAIAEAEKTGEAQGNVTDAKTNVLSSIRKKIVSSSASSDMPKYWPKPKLTKSQILEQSTKRLKKQIEAEHSVETARQVKAASDYYDRVLTEKIYAKEKASEELSALEASFKKEQEQSTAYQLRMKRFGAVDRMKNATTAEEVTNSYNEYLASVAEESGRVLNDAEDIRLTYNEKYENAENYTEEELAYLEELRLRLDDIRTMLEYELEAGGLTEEGKAALLADIENIGIAAANVEAVIGYGEGYEENKSSLIYQKMEKEYGALSISDIEALIAERERQKEETSDLRAILAKGRSASAEELIDAGERLNAAEEYNADIDKELAPLRNYLEQRKTAEENALQDERAEEDLAGVSGETLTQRTLFLMKEIEASNKRSDGVQVNLPNSFWKWSKEEKCEWFNRTYGTEYKTEDFNVNSAFKALNGKNFNIDATKDLAGYFHRHIVASNETLFTPETLEQYAAQAVADFENADFYKYTGDLTKYNDGIDGLFEGDYSEFRQDMVGFLKGDYGTFTKQDAKTILALMAKYGTDEAFVHYAAVRDDALKRKAQEFTGFGRVVRGVTSGLTQFITNGGEMLENAFTQQYSRIAGTLGTASHQINMENFSQKTGIGNDALELLYMSGYSIIDMAPAVALGAVPYVGTYLSSAYTFAKVTATTYNDSILAGKRADEALTYAMLSATAEVGMEKLLSTGGQTFAKGGLGKAWKEGVENLASTKAMQVIIKTAGSMGSEGFEEFLQECLSPFLEKVAADLNGIDDATLKEIDWEEAAKSFAIGAITGGILGGFEAVSSSKNAGMKESEAQALLESGKAVGIINAAAELGNKRALAIKQAIQNGQVLYEGQSGYFAYASPADIVNITQSVKRRSVKRSMSILQEKYNALETNKDKQKTFNRLFKKILNGNTLTLQETADIINDQEMSGILNEMLGMDVTMMTPDQVLAVAKLAAFAENGKISQARINLFKDAFGELDTKALTEIVKYSDMAAKKVSGIIYEDANVEGNLTEAEQESAAVLKILSAEVGTVFYVTGQFETGTYLAANMMAVRPGDLAGGVSQTVLKRVYYITMQLNPKAGKTIRDLVLGELKNKYTAEAFSAAVEQIRKEMAVNGNDVSFATAENELCAREFPSMMLEGALAENLAAEDLTAVQTIRKSLYAVQSHLSDQATLSAVRGKVSFDGVDQSKLNDRQKVTVQALSVCFGTMGINVEFFESPVNAEGQHVGINGSYDPATNTIRLDIAAGIKGEDAALFTAAHELTHFIKAWSEAKYQAFADFLLEKYAEHGVDVDALVQKKIEQSKNSSAYKEPLSPESALEEVICDSCETFLRDSNLMGTLSDMAKKDPSLYERIKTFFKDLLDRLRRSYQKLMPDSAEANIVLEMTDSIEKLHAMWADAALSARENAMSAQNDTQGEKRNADRNNYIENADDPRYNVNSPLSFLNRASENQRSSINWVYKAKIFSVVENKLFNEKISEINQGSDVFNKNLDEEYMLPIENKIVFTNGDYDAPYISRIIEVLTESATEYEVVKEAVFNVEQGKSRHKDEVQFLSKVFGNGFVCTYKSRVSGVYGWEDGRRKGKTRRAVISNYLRRHKRGGNDTEVTKTSLKHSDRNILDDEHSPTAKTNDLYRRLTALVRGEEVSVANDTEVDHDPTYTDADQVRAENDTVKIEDVFQAHERLKEADRNYQRELRRNALSEFEHTLVDALIRGEIQTEQLDSMTVNKPGVLAVYHMKAEKEKYLKTIRDYKKQHRAALFAEADTYLETANGWKDKKMGLSYEIETMERNVEDIVPDKALATEINKRYFEPIHKSAAEANRLKNDYRQKVLALGLSRKVAEGNENSEASAVQILGEVTSALDQFERRRVKDRKIDGRTESEWQGVLDDLWANNPNLDREKIHNAVEVFRDIYDDLFKQMNEARVRNGYEPVKYRKGYFLHFQPGETDSVLALFGKALGIGMEVDALPTTISGLTHTFKPGIQWFGSAMERKGYQTVYDAVEGFDKYIEGVADVICQTDNIQALRALATRIRYRTSDEGLQAQMNAIFDDESLDDIDKNNRIKELNESGRFTLSKFVVHLDEYTNLLANKKARGDRDAEHRFNRSIYRLVSKLESRVAANMIVGNVGSWLTNGVPLTAGFAELGTDRMLEAMRETVISYKKEDGFWQRSTFLTNRRGSDPIVRKWMDKTSATLNSPMEYIDRFVTDSLVRARYESNLAKGMSEEAAIDEADDWTARVVADRSKGATPTIFSQKHPFLKLFTQFQLEVNNNLSYMFKDLPRAYGKRGAAVVTAILLRFFIAGFLYDEIYEYFKGSRPAFDPFGILNDLVGDVTGYQLPNLLELTIGAFKGELPSFKTQKEDTFDVIKNTGKNVLEQVPFVGGILGGGRIPISSALPDWEKLGKALFSDKWDLKKRAITIGSELLNPAIYLATPFAGGQLKRSFQGIQAVVRSGSYSVNGDGEDVLQYPVYNDSFWDTAKNGVQAVLFGKTSLLTAQKWVDDGFDSMNAKETTCYKGLIEVGVSSKEAYSIVDDMRALKDTEDQSAEVQKRNYLKESSISNVAKGIVYYNLLAQEDERELMDLFLESETDMGEVYKALSEIRAVGSGEGAQKEKQRILFDADLTDTEKVAIYQERITMEHSEEISDLTDAGLTFDQYLSYKINTAAVDGKSANDYRKFKAIDETNADENVKIKAAKIVANDSNRIKLTIFNEYGIGLSDVVAVMDKVNYLDDQFDGGVTNALVKAAINDVDGLNDSQRAALWQLFTGATSGKNNPYSSSVGAKVAAKNKALKEAEKE